MSSPKNQTDSDETVRHRTVHCTCIVIDGKAVLLRGPSGSGKSDLALRLCYGDVGARLLSDDYVELTAEGGGLIARPPKQIRGLLEVRGIGICRLPVVNEAPLSCVVDLVGSGEIERLPDSRETHVEGFEEFPLPQIKIAPFEASASFKVLLGVRRLTADISRRDQQKPE